SESEQHRDCTGDHISCDAFAHEEVVSLLSWRVVGRRNTPSANQFSLPYLATPASLSNSPIEASIAAKRFAVSSLSHQTGVKRPMRSTNSGFSATLARALSSSSTTSGDVPPGATSMKGALTAQSMPCSFSRNVREVLFVALVCHDGEC